MRASELMNKIPGITADHLHNWEKQGYLSPNRVSLGKKRVRNYNKEDFDLIKGMWSYYQKGLSPRNAFRQAIKDLSKGPFLASPSLKHEDSFEEKEDRDTQEKHWQAGEDGGIVDNRIRGAKINLCEDDSSLEIVLNSDFLDRLLKMVTSRQAGEISLIIKIRK